MWANTAIDKGLLNTCRTTDNGLEFLLERGNGASFHLDEIKTGNNKVLADIAFMIAGGSGKKRMRADGSQRDVATWSTVVTVSSEKSLSSVVNEIGDTEVSGMHVRMPAINVSNLQPISPSDARSILAAIQNNYGYAGPEFVKALFDKGYVASPEKLAERIDQRQQALASKTILPTVERAARHFAILMVCGEIFVEADIVPVSKQDMADTVEWAWNNWLTGDDAKKLAPVSHSVDKLIAYLQNTPGKVKPTRDPDAATNEVLAYYDNDTVYLPTHSIDKIPGLQSSIQAILNELENRGLLIRQGRNRTHSRIPKVGELRPHYRIKLALYKSVSDEQSDAQNDNRTVSEFPYFTGGGP
jgi:hypothetical protein